MKTDIDVTIGFVHFYMGSNKFEGGQEFIVG